MDGLHVYEGNVCSKGQAATVDYELNSTEHIYLVVLLLLLVVVV